jgi:hypothetical protein
MNKIFFLMLTYVYSTERPSFLIPMTHQYSSNNFTSNITPRQIYITKKLLNSYMAYYILLDRNLSTDEILNICKYIHENYSLFEVSEKALVVGIWKLANRNNISAICELTLLLDDSYAKSPYKFLGNLIVVMYKLLELTSSTESNILVIQEILNNMYVISDNYDIYKKIIFYITNYYCSEYYLKLALEFFRINKIPETIIYAKRVLLRAHIHPKAALEAFLLMIEIFCLLENKLLVQKYLNILEVIFQENNTLKNYLERALYIVNAYKIL